MLHRCVVILILAQCLELASSFGPTTLSVDPASSSGNADNTGSRNVWERPQLPRNHQMTYANEFHEGFINVRAMSTLCLVASLVVMSYFAGSGRLIALLPVLGFMVCSSMMLIVNKLAITFFPFPGTILALQLFVCGAGVWLCGKFGFCEVEPLELSKVLAFGATPLAFLLTLVANIKVLEFANVETFIMVRNAAPLMTSVMDFIFLGRELPDTRSTLALVVALIGAGLYVLADASFQLRAYSWAAAWLSIFLFDQVYIKHVISTVPMKPWTRVYYNNLLASLPALVYAFAAEKMPGPLMNGWVGSPSIGAAILFGSCVMGTAMSYFAFRTRDILSATAFTVVGNVCKVLSVVVNVAVWDKHATSAGLGALFICMAGSAMYKPAPMRTSPAPSKV